MFKVQEAPTTTFYVRLYMTQDQMFARCLFVQCQPKMKGILPSRTCYSLQNEVMVDFFLLDVFFNVSWHHDWVFCCFQKCNKNLGHKCLYKSISITSLQSSSRCEPKEEHMQMPIAHTTWYKKHKSHQKKNLFLPLVCHGVQGTKNVLTQTLSLLAKCHSKLVQMLLKLLLSQKTKKGKTLLQRKKVALLQFSSCFIRSHIRYWLEINYILGLDL